MPAAALARTLTEREFREWNQYAARRMLPTRRLEMYLAQIAFLIARTMGNASEMTMTDFLFDPVSSEDVAVDDVDAMRQAFGFSPRNTGS